MLEGLDQYGLFGRALRTLQANPQFTSLHPAVRASGLRAAFQREFMAWRPSDHWAEFEHAPLEWWMSAIARFDASHRGA